MTIYMAFKATGLNESQEGDEDRGKKENQGMDQGYTKGPLYFSHLTLPRNPSIM